MRKCNYCIYFYCLLFLIGFFNKTMAQTKYYVNNVSIKCIAKTESKTNDLIYIKLFSKECGIKNTPTKAFKDGQSHQFTEINLDDLTKKNGWCVNETDRLTVMEKDIVDDDDLIFEITFTKENLLKQRFSFIQSFTIGKYEISFEVKAIKL
jgi:hypothetical protein